MEARKLKEEISQRTPEELAAAAKAKAEELKQKVVEGELPPTAEVTKTLERTKEALEQQARLAPLDAHGKKLVEDTSQFIATAKEFIEEKNEGEVFQKFVKDTKAAAEEVAEVAPILGQKTEIKATSREAQRELRKIQLRGKVLASVAKNLAQDIISYPEFRGLLVDLIDAIQDFAKAVSEEYPKKPITETLKKDVQKGDTSLTKTKEKAKEAVEEIKKDIQEKKVERFIPEERRQQLSNRFNELLRKLGSNHNFQTLVDNLFKLVDEVNARADSLKEKAKETKEELEEEVDKTKLERVWNDAKILLERFTGGKSLDSLGDKWNDLYYAIRDDPEVNQFFSDLRNYITGVIQNPEKLQDQATIDEGNRLMDRSQDIFTSNKYNERLNNILNDLRDILERIRTDPATNRLAEDGMQLARDFMLDEKNQLSWSKMQHSVNQLRTLVVPTLLAQLQDIPVPKLTGSDDTYDYELSNVALSGSEIVPEHVFIKFEDVMDVSTRQLGVSAMRAFIIFQINNMRVHLKNVNYWFRRKSFPKLTDEGVADVIVSGEETRLTVRWRVEQFGDEPFRFTTDVAHCHIENLKIRVKEAKHDFLTPILSKLFLGYIKRTIEEKIEDVVKEVADNINFRLNQASIEAYKQQKLLALKVAEQTGQTSYIPTILRT
jgi:hypothetical protein